MTKKQRHKAKLIWIYKGSSGSTANRKTSADNYQALYPLTNWYLGGQWTRMLDDVCK